MIRERKTVRSLGWTWLLTCAAMIVLPITITRAQQVQRPTNRPSSGSTRPTAAAPTSRPSQTADKHLHDVEIAVQLNRMLPELSFTGMGIGDVFAFLHDVSGIAIVVDWEQLNMAGVDRNTPITLHVRNERLGRCLSSVLEAPNLPEKLAYFVNGGSIEISTSAAIEKQAGGFIRSYSVGDLIHARAGASDTLMETIADSIDPTSWTLHGGSRTIRIEGDQLIVNQSPANQRAVASLLTGMRKLMRNSEIDLSR